MPIRLSICSSLVAALFAAVAASQAVAQIGPTVRPVPSQPPQIGSNAHPLPSDAARIASLEQEVTTLIAEVTVLQKRADNAIYVQTPSEGTCRYEGTISPNDILEATRTYHAVIDKAQSDFPLGYSMPVIQCFNSQGQ